jgi:hypothetical protein
MRHGHAGNPEKQGQSGRRSFPESMYLHKGSSARQLRGKRILAPGYITLEPNGMLEKGHFFGGVGRVSQGI